MFFTKHHVNKYMKRIALAALTDYPNYGDHFIAKCVDYLVRSKGEEYKTFFFNMAKRKKDYRYVIYGFFRILAKFVRNDNLSYKIIFLAMKINLKQYYKKQIKLADAIIFSCGSFKYGTQFLWCYYSLIVECAEELGISVMFDAMNIQEYADSDWRCNCLKKHANMKCVKMITTRDGEYGVNRLKKYYITNQDILLFPVGDPAFWIPECYESKKKESNVIGINVIRGNIFKDYGWRNISEEELLEVYLNLIKCFDREGIQWELFTNGLPEDHEFAQKIRDRITSDGNSIIRVPDNDKNLVEIICSYRGIVGARLHACICAYSLDIPVAGFIWDEKMLYFSILTNLKGCFVENEHLSGEILFEKMKNAIYNNKELSSVREEWKKKTKDTISLFLDMIKV